MVALLKSLGLCKYNERLTCRNYKGGIYKKVLKLTFHFQPGILV